MASDSDLPPDWASAVAPDSGKTYYYHVKTHETTWTKPTTTTTLGGGSGGASAASPESSSHDNNIHVSDRDREREEREHIRLNRDRDSIRDNHRDKFHREQLHQDSSDRYNLNHEDLEFSNMSREERKKYFVSLLEEELEKIIREKTNNAAAAAKEKSEKDQLSSNNGSSEPAWDPNRLNLANLIRWDLMLKRIEKDPRFVALESGGDRKQTFNETLSKLQIRKRDELRKKKIQAKQELHDVVLKHEWKNSGTYGSAGSGDSSKSRLPIPKKKLGTTFREVYDFLMQFECFKLLGPSDTDRDDAFQEYMNTWEAEERVRLERVRVERMVEFERRLEKDYINGIGSVDPDKPLIQSLRWRDIWEKYREDPVITGNSVSNSISESNSKSREKSESKTSSSSSGYTLEKADAIRAFEKWQDEAVEKQIMERKKNRFRRERKARQAFLDWLIERTAVSTQEFLNLELFIEKEQKQLAEAAESISSPTQQQNKPQYVSAPLEPNGRQMRLISLESSWAEVFNWYDLENVGEYKNLLDSNSGSTAQQLFLGHLEGLRQTMEIDRRKIEDILYDQQFLITPDTRFEDFCEYIRRIEKINPLNMKLVFEDLMKQEKVNRRKLVRLLADCEAITTDMDYDKACRFFRRSSGSLHDPEGLWNLLSDYSRREVYESFWEQISSRIRNSSGAGSAEHQHDHDHDRHDEVSDHHYRESRDHDRRAQDDLDNSEQISAPPRSNWEQLRRQAQIRQEIGGSTGGGGYTSDDNQIHESHNNIQSSEVQDVDYREKKRRKKESHRGENRSR